jgi:hypothetical protein
LASSGSSSGLSSISVLSGSGSSGFSRTASSISSFGSLDFFLLSEPFSFFSFFPFSFLGFFSLLVGFYTLIFVSLQWRRLGVRRTLPSVLATTQDGTGCACFNACERCFFLPEGLCRAIGSCPPDLDLFLLTLKLNESPFQLLVRHLTPQSP